MSDLARLETEVVRAGVLLATLAGEIDISNAAELEARLVAAGDVPALVVDLTSVTFLDSSGVRLLDHLVAAREPDPLVQVVVATTGPVPFTLRLCGFRTDLIAGSREEALAALAR